MTEPPEVLTPQQAAHALGVSPSGLRRLASIYEQVRGELPRVGAGRVWPHDAVAELKRARELVTGQQAGSIEAALRGGGTLVDLSENLARNPDGAGTEIERLLRELINENRAMHEELRTLRGEVAKLRELPPAKAEGAKPETETPKGGFWQRFRYYWRNP